MTKEITIKLEMTLTVDEVRRLRLNSIERVMNNAIAVGSYVENLKEASNAMQEDGSSLWQDCEELLPITRKIWNAVTEATRIEEYKNK